MLTVYLYVCTCVLVYECAPGCACAVIRLHVCACVCACEYTCARVQIIVCAPHANNWQYMRTVARTYPRTGADDECLPERAISLRFLLFICVNVILPNGQYERNVVLPLFLQVKP